MTCRVVTSTYRDERRPRKRKAVPLQGPMIVGKCVPYSQQASAPAAAADDDRKPAIVTSKPKRQRKAWVDDGQETMPEIKAFVARMMRPPGQ